jgi:hypothetical protein
MLFREKNVGPKKNYVNCNRTQPEKSKLKFQKLKYLASQVNAMGFKKNFFWLVNKICLHNIFVYFFNFFKNKT